MRVLHIVGKMDRAGAETMLMNLYRNIDRAQIQFDFITFTNEKGDYDDEIYALGGEIHAIIANNPIERMLKLRDFLKKHSEYKIVHAHMLLSNTFHLLAAKLAGIPHRIAHSHNTNTGKSGIIVKLYEKFGIHLINKLSTKKIACGKEAAEYLYNTAKDVWILKNAINLNSYQHIAIQNKDYWSITGLPFQGLKLIQVGRLNEVKNHIFSLRVAKRLRESGIEFTLFIVGQGPLENLIKQKIIDNKLEENVFILGVRADVPQLMAGADVMLMPSLHEGFPVVLVESQAIGLPSLLSENIAKEVDLNLNLIEFLSLKHEDMWVKVLRNLRNKPVSQEEIYKRLQISGFDVKKNASDLLEFYNRLNSSYLEK